MGAARKTKASGGQANAVIYARYSSHGQQEQSIDGQLRDCRAYAEREGLKVVGEYIDRAISGKTDDRPDFQRMISDAAKRQFQSVIVWKLDRFARNRFDSAIHKATLKKCGVRVVSATEGISDSPEGIILEGVLESMAEYYSENLSKHVKRGQRESVLKGSHVGGIAPFGFKSVTAGDKKRLVADENKAPIIQYIFAEYAKSTPKRKIMDELNRRGMLNYYGRPLTLSCLQHALRNTKYVGKYTFNGEEVPGACDALISEEVFNAVQKRLDEVKHAPAAQKAREEYLLQGKAFCGHCGARLVGDAGTSRRGKVHHYYACGNRKKLHTCEKKNEKKDFLEWYVVEQTVEYVLSPDRIEGIAEGVAAAYADEFNDKRIEELERQAAKLDREAANLVDAIAEGNKQAAARLMERINAIETQKADIELNIATLRIANGHRLTEEQIAAWLKSFCAGDELDAEYQRRIINLFINAVYLYDDKMAIYYNIKGGKQVSYIDMRAGLEKLEPSDDTPLDSKEPPGDNNEPAVRISHTPPPRMSIDKMRKTCLTAVICGASKELAP